MNLGHFNLYRSVGKGAFGKVRVVEFKKDKNIYALKYINKEKCIKQNAVSNIIQERRMLELIEHPFIVNLRFSFQDDENMFMVLDLMLGGDLRFHMDKQIRFTEHDIKIYIAECALALNYLHSQGIVHRDLKPDNLLLDKDGHVHLTDFNIATYLPEDGNYLKSTSGTPAYMAPEMVAKIGYRTSVDWWSLGIILFEIMFHKRPFRGETVTKLHADIKRGKFYLPKNEFSEELNDLCVKLLKRNPEKRLGCGENGFENLKNHKFFSGLDWEAVERKEVKPNYIPDADKVNFDVTHELEEVSMESNPLRVRRRSKKLEEMSPEMRQIEVEFEDFNTNDSNVRRTIEMTKKQDFIKDTLRSEEIHRFSQYHGSLSIVESESDESETERERKSKSLLIETVSEKIEQDESDQIKSAAL